jgi:hypothetical protein
MIVDRELLEWDLELPQRGVVDTLCKNNWLAGLRRGRYRSDSWS